MSWPKAFNALLHPGFRLLLLGQAVSLQGTWVQGTAQRWLVLELSDSPWMVGLLGAVSGLPILFFAFWGGMLADRHSRITVLVTAHAFILLQAVLLGFFVQTGVVEIVHVLLLAFVLGTSMAVEVPARQALVFDLVGREHITNALALHSTAFNLARFAGPAIAGWLMAVGSMAGCFYFKAVSALVVILVLLLIRKTSPSSRPASGGKVARPGPRSAIKNVYLFARGNRIVWSVLIIIMTFGICLLPYSILLPSLGRDVLGLGAKEYGYLCSSNGLGALMGAVFVAFFGHKGKRESWWWWGAFLFPLSLILLGFSHDYYQAMVILCLSGFTMVITSTSAISLLQLEADDSLRGQTMGLFTTSFMGLFPFGSLVQGAAAQFYGIRPTLLVSSSVAILVVAMVRRSGRIPGKPGNRST